MNTQTARVIDLLTYIEEVEKLRRNKPVYALTDEYFVAHQAELAGLPELQVNVPEPDGEDGQTWLRVPRLEELPAPALPPGLVSWVSTTSNNPDKPPTLKAIDATSNACDPAQGNAAAPDAGQAADGTDIPALFDWYIALQWEPWRTAEQARRKTIALYRKLFLLHHTLTGDGADNPVELVWGLGMALWKRSASAPVVAHPLITQACELRLNEKSFALEITPRQAQARMELDCYADMQLGAVEKLEKFWKATQSQQAAAPNLFQSESFEGVLKTAVAELDPAGRYEPGAGNCALPAPGENLLVSSAWVVFARKRSADIFLEDVRRLKASLEDGAQVPAVIGEFVTEGDAQVRPRSPVVFRGLSGSVSGPGVRDLYFPMPYNDEQVAIAAKLEHNSGVVVQGPPGTGKTHTIANIICHFLAQGKRVLVTSKGDTALAVLRDKLPERIRTLSVGLLSNEQDGMRQFEHSISSIAAEVSALQPDRLQANIAACEDRLNELHARIAAIDHALDQDAARNTQNYQFLDKEVSAQELAKLVVEQMDDHLWFEDTLATDAAQTPPIQEADVQRLRHARAQCKADLSHVGLALPDPGALPTWEVLGDLHRDMVRARTIERDVERGAVLPLSDASLPGFEAAQTLLETLTGCVDALAAVRASEIGNSLLTRIRGMAPDDVLLVNLRELKQRFCELDEQRKKFIAQAIEAPQDAQNNQDFLDALERLEQRKSAFPLPFGKGVARKQIAEVTVAGARPADAAQWQQVRLAIKWRLDAGKALARYATLGAEFGVPAMPRQELYAGVRSAAGQLTIVDTVLAVPGSERGLGAGVERVFGALGAAHLEAGGEAGLAAIRVSLRAQLDKGRLGYAMRRAAEYAKLVDGAHETIQQQVRHFLLESLGAPAQDEAVLRTQWLALVQEIERLTALKPLLDLIESSCSAIAAGGAPIWAGKLRSVAPALDFDPLLPTNWSAAWAWRIACNLLEQIDAHSRQRARFAERRDLTTRLAKTYQDLVAERAWLGVYNNSPPNVRQALQAYLTAVQLMGKGTGVRVERHRKSAREAMERARHAVPCWILPQWRVSETLPAELGQFDLVIVDEASQSDIWTFPALMRGRKLLIVGDHKQVSPSVVGMREQGIVDIQRRFLANQPHGKNMTPDMSIYDLARVVFAGNSVMLREHFRCVSPIIEYSNREFYNHEIRPLRLPRSTERLDPPLIDVFVTGGYRKGDRNPVEAQAIVDEIAAILTDTSLAGRSIGVVTLLGSDQAKLIFELIDKKIPKEEVLGRQIVVGQPALFQGRERDIMMVSMVLGRGDRAAADALGQQQRFNVALSRARDRTYLFRSVEHEAFGQDSLTGRLLAHFRQPFKNPPPTSGGRDLCESGFEQEMFDALSGRGFRVQPQVPCGGYRIDFVVEGSDGRRLAVECDGDRFHGPQRWGEDMARQRVLERAGWVFWRCFASSFVRRRQRVLDDLFSTLATQGIEPLADAPEDSSVWVKTKIVDPLRTGDPVADTAQESV